MPVEVAPGHEYMVHRHGFLCATSAIQIGVGFQQSLGAGIFGGDGFLLQKIGGQGIAWLELSGEVVIQDLAAWGTPARPSRPCRGVPVQHCFPDPRVPGIKNMIFGGDGIFLAALTGPGRVWLQTLPISRLAHQLQEYLPKERAQQAVEGGVVGGIVGSILKGM